MSACGQAAKQEPIVSASTELHQVDLVSAGTLVFDLASVPAYSGQPYAIVNDNKYFTDADLTAVSFETYSDLDSLGRCGVAYASVGKDLMPTEERGSIGQVKPSGWHTIKYDNVDGKYLYNRCHLIGFSSNGSDYINICHLIGFSSLQKMRMRRT